MRKSLPVSAPERFNVRSNRNNVPFASVESLGKSLLSDLKTMTILSNLSLKASAMSIHYVTLLFFITISPHAMRTLKILA